MQHAVEALCAAVLASSPPLVVAVDGRSGAGKSTLTAEVAAVLRRRGLQASVLDGDAFYAGGSSATWDRRTAAEKVAGGIDWRRQRQVLEALRRDGSASWHGFDWDGDWDADPAPLAAHPTHTALGDVLLLDGAYSARPELADLLDLRVLLDVPTAVCAARVRIREGDEYQRDWAARWLEAEAHYFHCVMPAERFDLVLRPEEG